MRILATIPSVLLAACQLGTAPVDYYSGDAGPSVDGVSVSSEQGNLGGQLITITGNHFGSEPDAVTVVIGSRNAQILTVEDSEITAVVPPGPQQAGAVDIVVGTPQGQFRSEDAYTYDLSDFYDNELGYIAVTNDYWSCIGGVGSDLDPFCSAWSMTGDAGVEGQAEVLEFKFPLLHSPYAGARGGFVTDSDQSIDEWTVELPSYSINTLDLEGEIERNRVDLGDGFTLRNPNIDSAPWCADMTAKTDYYYGGGDYSSDEGKYYAPVTIGAGNFTKEANCDDPWAREYDLSTMHFCEEYKWQSPHPQRYMADWPVGDNKNQFFMGVDGNGRLSADAPATVLLDVPGLDLQDVELNLPEYPHFKAVIGASISDEPGYEDYLDDWGVYGFSAQCPDSDGDGVTGLNDAFMRWEWEPQTADLSPNGAVKDTKLYVRATVTLFTLSWMGGEGMPLRATITVPDEQGYLELPTSVMYQFPTAGYDTGPVTDMFGNVIGFNWGDPAIPGDSILIMSMERVAEYQIGITTPQYDGDLIFSYTSGELGQLFYDNPLDGDDCSNCIDGDGDGWVDDADPDCAAGDVEDDSTFGGTTCNDGLDNDGDGDIDADDADCEDGFDGETNCSDGEDNDGDGLVDEEDGECGPLGTGVEVGDDDPTWECGNGVDDDADGWTDLDDPDCVSASNTEDGFGDTACNDGVDNDGHGDVDADDVTCMNRGGDYDSETPSFQASCVDDIDNDDDGYIDGNDPDCEYAPYAYENHTSLDEAEHPEVRACYNGVDDDGDGYIDAEDPGCVNEAGDLDGFVDSEVDPS